MSSRRRTWWMFQPQQAGRQAGRQASGRLLELEVVNERLGLGSRRRGSNLMEFVGGRMWVGVWARMGMGAGCVRVGPGGVARAWREGGWRVDDIGRWWVGGEERDPGSPKLGGELIMDCGIWNCGL